MKRVLAFLALTLAIPTCGADEASPEEIIAALCTRLEECKSAPSMCKTSYKTGCAEGETFDREGAFTCVERLKSATCEEVKPAISGGLGGICDFCH